jgi:hypothetical protein
MKKIYRIELDVSDLGQLLDGLNSRAESWEKTTDYHRTGHSPPDFIIEESNDAHEAESIANHYRSIIAKIQEQQEAQS